LLSLDLTDTSCLQRGAGTETEIPRIRGQGRGKVNYT